jgi:hypothetical protein
MEITRDHFYPVDQKGKVPEIFNGQELELQDGSLLEIGHVFAGLDALNFPNSIESVEFEFSNDSPAAVTWTGDLGSALAEMGFYALNHNKAKIEDLQKIIDEYASPHDMLGNIDAYVVNNKYDTKATQNGQKVSEILSEYYLNSPGSKTVSFMDKRYAIFARQAGLGIWDGERFSKEPVWVERYSREVTTMATLYALVSAKDKSSFPAYPGMLGSALGVNTALDMAKLLLYNFISALREKAKEEPHGNYH